MLKVQQESQTTANETVIRTPLILNHLTLVSQLEHNVPSENKNIF